MTQTDVLIETLNRCSPIGVQVRLEYNVGEPHIVLRADKGTKRVSRMVSFLDLKYLGTKVTIEREMEQLIRGLEKSND